ncbi:DinB family protein [Pedobacter cryoconitis]|uniref:DinB family protein n=1 Tax=Pedobacter cryoconitis TaxID=188932 RepID=A0A327RZ87_9SPHI|nr:DinB family protein [Pedobacter cryoconitis]RAJ22220.1 DinB family protein [Pedobacter cryoconitis]
MIVQSIQRLQYLCNTIPPLLNEIDDHIFSLKPAAAQWSKKEIIGHLIDSAAANHQRFVRAQFEDIPKITYDQNNCNIFSYYQQIDREQVISFWTAYNKQILALIKLIPEAALHRECLTGGEQSVTLAFLFDDYVQHLEHHLKQVVSY